MKRRNFFKAMITAPIVFGGAKRVIGAPAEPESLEQPGSPKPFGSGELGYVYRRGNAFVSGL